MKKILFAVLFLVLIGLPLVLAATDITIRASPKNSVAVNIINPDTGDARESWKGDADESGIYEFSSNISGGKYNLYIIVRDNGKIVDTKNIDGVVFGGTLSFDLNDAPVVEAVAEPIPEPVVENETQNATEEVVEDVSAEGNSPVTGSVIKELPRPVYYVLGVIVLGIVVWFVLSKTGMPTFSMPARSGGSSGRFEQKSADEKILMDAEAKIKQAQQEINSLRNKDKIRVAERRLEEYKSKVEKLRSGEDVDI